MGSRVLGLHVSQALFSSRQCPWMDRPWLGHCHRPKPHSQGPPLLSSVPGVQSLPRQEQRDEEGDATPRRVGEGFPICGGGAAWRGGASDSSFPEEGTH